MSGLGAAISASPAISATRVSHDHPALCLLMWDIITRQACPVPLTSSIATGRTRLAIPTNHIPRLLKRVRRTALCDRSPTDLSGRLIQRQNPAIAVCTRIPLCTSHVVPPSAEVFWREECRHHTRVCKSENPMSRPLRTSRQQVTPWRERRPRCIRFTSPRLRRV